MNRRSLTIILLYRAVATVLITRGQLNAGAVLVAGQTWAKVRTITNDKGQIIKSCGPGSPVSITGWKSVPSAGQEVLETKDGESSAIKAVTNRARGVQIQKDLESLELINEVRRAASAEHEEALQKRREVRAARSAAFLAGEKMPASEWIVQTPRETEEEEAGKQKELLLIVKGDVSGTVEAVVGTLETIGNKEAKARIIRSGVGDVQPSDVEYAASSGGSSFASSSLRWALPDTSSCCLSQRLSSVSLSAAPDPSMLKQLAPASTSISRASFTASSKRSRTGLQVCFLPSSRLGRSARAQSSNCLTSSSREESRSALLGAESTTGSSTRRRRCGS